MPLQFLSGKHMRFNRNSEMDNGIPPDKIQFQSFLIYNDYYRERKNNSINRDIYSINQTNAIRFLIRSKKINFSAGAFVSFDRRIINYDVTEIQYLSMESVSDEYGVFVKIPLWIDALVITGIIFGFPSIFKLLRIQPNYLHSRNGHPKFDTNSGNKAGLRVRKFWIEENLDFRININKIARFIYEI